MSTKLAQIEKGDEISCGFWFNWNVMSHFLKKKWWIRIL